MSNACCTQSVHILYTTPLYLFIFKKIYLTLFVYKVHTLCVQQALLISYRHVVEEE
jgi:hypothetical protein